MDRFTTIGIAFLALALTTAEVAAAPGDLTRFLEGQEAGQLTAAELSAEVKGFLPSPVDFRAVLPPPPIEGSPEDGDDVDLQIRISGRANEGRWLEAERDDASVFDRFSDALGAPLDRRRFPRLVQLLNRVMRDVSASTFAAKQQFGRLRPYQRFRLRRVCGEDAPPAPEPDAKERSSYPSGHSSYGWAVALILAKVAPQRAQAVLERGRRYGESRVICGMHFPTDVEAGRIIATAVVSKLSRSQEFRRALREAWSEFDTSNKQGHERPKQKTSL